MQDAVTLLSIAQRMVDEIQMQDVQFPYIGADKLEEAKIFITKAIALLNAYDATHN